MSMPVLLTMAGAVSVPVQMSASTNTTTLLLDEHRKSCASYVETTPIITSQCTTPTSTELNELEVMNAGPTAADCAHVLRSFTVELSADIKLHSNELVGLTGDSKALGEWQLERSIPLRPIGNSQWSANVLIQICRSYRYRYFIYVEDKQGRKQIRRWETQMQPRILKDCTNGCETVIDHFGMDATGEMQVNRGWLTNDAILQFKFDREQLFQVLDIDRFDPENIRIRVVPLNDDLQTVLESTDIAVNVEVVKLKYGESQLQPQHASGATHKRGEVVIFHITVPHPLQNAFALIFDSADGQTMGKTVIAASDIMGSEGVLELMITGADSDVEGSNTTVARLYLPYVIVKPFVEAPLGFRTTYAHYWPKCWPNLDVGHRGNGRSFIADPPAERENTVASFMRAYERFADMVEFDVHLTSDGIPIIYHDFGVRSAPQGKAVTSADQLEYVLIKDVTYEALKKLRIFAVVNGKPVEFPSHNAEPRVEHRIFPRLIDVMKSLPKSLGMDVEIKWPQIRECGQVETAQTIDKNFFIDRVLSIVINHGCGRPLIFSSFDADICTMLRFKQNIFPVMFLTMGETKKWLPFADLRTRTFEHAVNNAQAFELAGTAPHAEDFLVDNAERLIEKARNLGQITVIWGDDCNSKERVKYFTEIGATATCYDRADLYMPEHKQRSFFNSTNLMVEFENQCDT